jgi:hypothetical protein
MPLPLGHAVYTDQANTHLPRIPVDFRKTRFTGGRVRELKNAHNSVTVQNRTYVYVNFFITKAYEITSCSNVHKSWNTLYV